jgi:hypothetical protein
MLIVIVKNTIWYLNPFTSKVQIALALKIINNSDVKLLMVHICKNDDAEIDHYNYLKEFMSFGLCSVLLFVLVFDSVFTSSSFSHPNNVFADDMMGGSNGGGGDSGSDSGDSGGGDNNNDDGSNDMPKEAPLTTDALTAGGGSGNDDDGGNNYDDNNNQPASEDTPQTANTVTTNKPKCSPGQENYLFSSGCQPTSTAGVCPSSYSSTEDSSITRGILKGNSNNEIIINVPETQQFLIYQVADGDNSAGTEQDDKEFGTFGQQSTRASASDPCPSEGDEQVSETKEHLPDGGSKTTRTNQDGTSVVTILNLNGVRDPEGKLVPGAVEQDIKFNAQNKLTKTDSYDRSQNVVGTTSYDPKSGNPTQTTYFAPNGDVRGTAAYSYNAQNKLTQVFHLNPQNNLLDRTVNTYTPNNLPRTSTTYDSNNQPTSKTVYAGGNTPLSETYYVDGKPISVTRYDESGKTIGTFGPDGKPLGSSPATSTTTTTLPNTQ